VCKDVVIDLYERHSGAYDRDRARSTFFERRWLDRFLGFVPRGEPILDVGCGVGAPIARYLIDLGFEVVGVDGAPSMVRLCNERFPDSEWIVADMRGLELGRRFAGVLAWDSFFHLSPDDQRAVLPRLAAHCRGGAPLLFTSGPAEGEAIGTCQDEPLYHASLAPGEYRRLLGANGFSVVEYVPDDPTCGGHTVWLATRAEEAPA
jgi:SAM-dependent methyltransferase